MNRYNKILHWLTGLGLSIGFLIALRQLQVPYFLYYPRTANTVLISGSFDLYFFAVTSLCVPGQLVCFIRFQRQVNKQLLLLAANSALMLVSILLISYSQYAILLLYFTVLASLVISISRTPERNTVIAYALTGALTVLALVEFPPIYYWASLSANPYAPYGVSSYVLETDLTYSLFFLAPAILIAILISWLWIPILPRFFHAKRQIEEDIKTRNSTIDKRLLFASLDLFAIVAILIFTFLYLAGQPWIVGVDSLINYLYPLNTIRTLPLSQALVTSISLFHGIYVGILYVAAVATGLSSFMIVKYAPLLLAFATSSLVFLAFLKAGWSYRLTLLSSLCTLLWLPTTIGFFAGIQANWLALSLWMLSLTFLFAKRASRISFLIQSVIPAAILIVHPWTWGVFLATTVIMRLLSRRTGWERQSIGALSSSLALALPVGALALYLAVMSGDMNRAIMLYAHSILNPGNLLRFGGAMVEMLHQFSSYFSPVLLLIALVGAYSLKSRSGVTKTYLLAWIIAWCVGSILAAPLGYVAADPVSSETEVWRTMYLSPLPILLALGIESCFVWSRRLKPFDLGRVDATREEAAIILVTLALSGVGLSIFVDPVLRMCIFLVAASGILLLATRLSAYHVVRIMILSILLLFVVNAALRSLSPLLLDPHNVLHSLSG